MCSRVGETHFTRDMCSGEHISRRNIYHFDVTVICVPPIKREDHSLLPDAIQRNAERCQAFIKTEAATMSNGRYSGTPPYDHPVYKTTSLLRPYSFKPNVTTIESFSYFEDPVNATTSLLRPGFYGPTVVALTGFHCIEVSRKEVI